MNMTVYPVFRFVDDHGKEHFWLVLKTVSKNGDVKDEIFGR